jgi:hypothetical protein
MGNLLPQNGHLLPCPPLQCWSLNQLPLVLRENKVHYYVSVLFVNVQNIKLHYAITPVPRGVYMVECSMKQSPVEL